MPRAKDTAMNMTTIVTALWTLHSQGETGVKTADYWVRESVMIRTVQREVGGVSTA